VGEEASSRKKGKDWEEDGTPSENYLGKTQRPWISDDLMKGSLCTIRNDPAHLKGHRREAKESKTKLRTSSTREVHRHDH